MSQSFDILSAAVRAHSVCLSEALLRERNGADVSEGLPIYSQLGMGLQQVPFLLLVQSVQDWPEGIVHAAGKS